MLRSVTRLLRDQAEVRGPFTLGDPDPVTFEQSSVAGPKYWQGPAALQDAPGRRDDPEGTDHQVLQEVTIRVPADGWPARIAPGDVLTMTKGRAAGVAFQIVEIEIRTNQATVGLRCRRWSRFDPVESRP